LGKGEYARSGVDYTKIQAFKDMMREAGTRTLDFPLRRGVVVIPMAHGVNYHYTGPSPHHWVKTGEGLGNKDIIAEWMRLLAPDSNRTYYEGIGYDLLMMGVNDVIAQGALPVVCVDEIAAGSDDWFTDKERSAALAESMYRGCQDAGMALGAGESPAYRYLVNPWRELPEHLPPSLRQAGAPVMGCTVTGIVVPPDRLMIEDQIRAGDVIIGARSSGLHSNGISLVLKRSFEIPDGLLTDIGDDRIYGLEALIPTMCYVGLVEAILETNIPVHTFLPATGDGVAKLAFEKMELTYEVTHWPLPEELPPLFLYLWRLGVSFRDMLKTFNMGIGYYVFCPESSAADILRVGTDAGYQMMAVGRVVEGRRQTIFKPAGYETISLPPPGED
jgi:phosphoribosylformylglycinamidine cyclo-ligase